MKDKMLNDYREMNRHVATKLQVPYIDVRSALKKSVPFYRLSGSGCVTLDGEHLNSRGVAEASYLFAQAIYDFVNKQDGGTKGKTS
jgi:hypothetical protein